MLDSVTGTGNTMVIKRPCLQDTFTLVEEQRVTWKIEFVDKRNTFFCIL